MTDKPEDLDDGGQSVADHSQDLAEYMAFQDSVIGPELRQVRPGEHPFPTTENPEFAYLVDRALEIAKDSPKDPMNAILWVAVHAWRAGAIDAAVRAELAASTDL